MAVAGEARMTTIVFLGDDKTVSVDDPNTTILDVSIAHKIPHLRECGGTTECAGLKPC